MILAMHIIKAYKGRPPISRILELMTKISSNIYIPAYNFNYTIRQFDAGS